MNTGAKNADIKWQQMRSSTLLGDIPASLLEHVFERGEARIESLDRDHILPSSFSTESLAPICFVMQGDIAAGLCSEPLLQERIEAQQRIENASVEELKELSKLPRMPLARMATKNLALFSSGDVFHLQSVMAPGGENTEGSAATGTRTVFYTVSPSTVVFINQSILSEWSIQYPAFAETVRQSVQSTSDRFAQIVGVKQEVLDFFVRQGIVVSGDSIRVRQLDRCIDCKQCEIACEQRYGAQRLTLGGFQLGMLDFVFTCRTCVDQRCLDPCDYDAIAFDENKGEVVIKDESCTGCTLCAQACPYGAIEMVDIEDPKHPTYRKAFHERLHKNGVLEFGPGKPRIGRPRRIANKCDHCSTYADQACISACPTGSLIEINPFELFAERAANTSTDKAAGKARSGKLSGELLPLQPFAHGVGVRDGGIARIKRRRFAPLTMWFLGSLAFVLAFVEILLRKFSPEQSLAFYRLQNDPEFAGLAVEGLIDKLDYHGGTPLALWCGYIGTGLMVVAAVYPMFRRIKAFRFLASNTMWFDFHTMAGTVGPMFIFLHTAFRLDTWVAFAFWSMVVVVASGIIGRYLYTQLPDMLGGRQLEELHHRAALREFSHSHPKAYAIAREEIEVHGRSAAKVAEKATVIGAFTWLVAEDFRRITRYRKRVAKLRRAGIPKQQAREVGQVVGRMLIVNRSKVVAPRAQLVLHSWKKIHVPFTLLLVVLAALHIYIDG